MKTITLTDEAYERLRAWKTGKDSFSQVVLRIVAKRGTFGDLDESFKALPALSDASPTNGEARPSESEGTSDER